MLDEKLLHEIDINPGPALIFSTKHLAAPPRKEGEVVQEHRIPLILRRELDQMADILEEIARQEHRMAGAQGVNGEDGEIDVEGDKQGIQRLVNLSGRRDRAKRHSAILEIDEVPLGFEDAPGVQFVEFGGRKVMVEDGFYRLGVDMRPATTSRVMIAVIDPEVGHRDENG